MNSRFLTLLTLVFAVIVGWCGRTDAQTLYTTWPNNDGYNVDDLTIHYNVTTTPAAIPGAYVIHGYAATFIFSVVAEPQPSGPPIMAIQIPPIPGGPVTQTSPTTASFTETVSISEAAQQPGFDYVSNYPKSNLLPTQPATVTKTLYLEGPGDPWQDTLVLYPYFYWNNIEGWFGGTSLAAIVSPYPNSYPTHYQRTESITLQAEPCPTCSQGGSGGGGCASCGGSPNMTTYSLDKLHASFKLTDTPVSYSPPVGSMIGFTFTYNQGYLGQLAAQPFSNLGPNWTYNWLSYITNRPDDVSSNVTRFAPGGGLEYYSNFTVPVTANGTFDPKTQRYSFPQVSNPERTSRAVLSWDPTQSRYTRTLPDGSSEIYGQWVNSGGTNYYLLTQQTDAQGNVIKLGYDTQGRLITITDPVNQVTTLSYGLSSFPLLITKVTDPFGRIAQFQYDAQGRFLSSTDPIGLVSSFGYGAGNMVTSLTTPYGTTTFSVESDAFHNAVNVTNPLGQTERVEMRYNSVSTIADSDSKIPTFNSAYIPTGYTLTNSGLSSNNTYYWDRKQYAAHNPIQYTDAQITHWQMGSHGLCPAPACTKQPLENRIWYVYANQMTPGFVADSDQTSPVATGRILDDGTTQATYAVYNTQGKITQKVDPIGRTSNMTYDAATGIDLLTITQKNGTGSDLLSTNTYTNSTQTASIHKPLTTVDASGQTTTMTYNSQGQILTSTDPKNEKTTYSYTGANGTGTGNYLTTVTAPMTGAIKKYTYDIMSRVSTVTDSEGYVVNYNYDNLNRIIKVIYPDGTFEQTVYQNLDPIKMIDRQSRTTIKQYDAIRELVSVTDPLNRTIQYGWCLCGGLASLTDSNHNLTQWTLDLQGRITAKTYADNTQILYTYETTNSRLHQIQDANSNKAVFIYNEDNTLASTTYTTGTGIAATPNVSFTYDPFYQRIKTRIDGVGTTTYTYNTVPTTGLPVTGANMLGSILVPVGVGNNTAPVGNATIAYTYDQLGRIVNYTTDGSSNSVVSAYDSLGRVVNITNPLGSFVYAYVNTTNRLKSLTYPASSGLVSNMNYYSNVSPSGTGNGDERLETISNVEGAINISNFSYTYSPVGTIATWQQQTDANVATQYALTYDVTNQLVNAVNTNTSTHATVNSNTYEYDLMGNRLAETTQSSTNVGQFNNLNQLTYYGTSAVTQTVSGHTSSAITSGTIDTVPVTISNSTNFTGNIPVPPGTNTITIGAQNGTNSITNQKVQIVTTGGTVPVKLAYDKNGNITQDEAGNTYTWDALNRLITIKYSSNATSNFTYDGNSRRTSIIEKNSLGTVTTTKLYLWLGNTIVDERNSANVVQKRFYSQGEQQLGTPYLYTKDHLGSIRELVSSTGAIISRISYDLYGRATIISGTTLPTFQYAGYYNHLTSGLYLTKYRFYDSNSGRWLSRDPLKAAELSQGPNLYIYSQDQPDILIDPLGLGTLSGPAGYPRFPINDPQSPLSSPSPSGINPNSVGDYAGAVGIAITAVQSGFSEANCLNNAYDNYNNRMSMCARLASPADQANCSAWASYGFRIDYALCIAKACKTIGSMGMLDNILPQ